MNRRIDLRAASILFVLLGCSNKRDLGTFPDGGGGDMGTAGMGSGAAGQGGQGGGTAGTGGGGSSGGSISGGGSGGTGGTGGSGTAGAADGGGGDGGTVAGGGGGGGNGGATGGNGGGSAGSTECPGLRGYWPADDDATDHVGDNDGILQGGVTFARGKVGDAFVFDGQSSVVATRAPGVATQGSWSYSLWINVTSYPFGDATLFIDRTSNTLGLASLKATGGSFQFQVRYDDGTGLGGPVGGTIQISTWTHLALVRDVGRQFYLYVDGQNVASTPDNGASLDVPPFKLGQHFDAADSGFSGLIDELQIYDGALTAAQVQALANGQPCH